MTDLHFIDLYAVWRTKHRHHKYLLAFSPLVDKEDFSAEAHANFIKSVLAKYKKDLQNVACIVGDNCNTNKATAKLLGVPLVGCASHR